MALAAPTLPQIEQPVFPARSDAPAGKPVTSQRWITAGALLAFIIAIVANLLIIAVIVIRHDPVSTATTHAQGQTVPAPPAPLALPPGFLATSLGAGKFVVGTDIAPGTYRTTGPSGHLDCYWERLKNTSSGTDSIIANNLGRGPATVTIDNNDGAFQTRWCNTWTRID
ncbi:MAG: hypothetical protein ACRDQ4_02865 [Pseudonocardiaceae bacterium]